MNRTQRRYAIHTLATVSLFAAAGCFDKGDDDEDDGDGGDGGGGSSIIGLWGLDSLSYSYYGETYSVDYPYSYTEGGTTYTYGIRMDIRTADAGEFYTYYEYSSGGESYSSTEDGYEITVTETGTATYRIQVHDELVMDCTMSGSRLACDAVVDGDMPLTLDWSRR
ncbi:MAG: hypothetical protein H6742_07955 [Alphaproteobacteria bacterium]|nr:hypothetical protein [Alphaproteobacteria bacterium]